MQIITFALMELIEKLVSEGRRHGICADGLKHIISGDKAAMVDYYIRIIDWSLENGFPDLDTIRAEFSGFENKGIFVDRTFNGELLSGKQTYIFHNCKGRINVAMDYDNATIPMLYFANGCNMEVVCGQKNNPAIIVPLYVFGDNEIKTDGMGNADFKYHKHETI